MNIFKRFTGIFIIIILSIFAVKPFFNSGFFPIHDDTQVARVFEMHKSLSDGMFPVRWVADLGYGYGYPIFNFYAPLAYYKGAAFMFLGFDALNATKIMMVLGIFLSGVFMYFFANEFWGKTGGVISALLYIYAPYHALDIYVRGDVAEFWAYAFIPLAFFAVYKIYQNLKFIEFKANTSGSVKPKFAKNGKSHALLRNGQNSKVIINNQKITWLFVCLGAISYAAIILSHNLTAMMASPFLFAFSLILYIKLRTIGIIYKPYFILLSLLLGIILSAFYWLPVFPELSYTNVLSVVGGGSKYEDHFACASQLWNSPWGFAGSAPGCIDGFSLKIGKLHILLSLFSLSVLYFMARKNKDEFILVGYFIFTTLFSIFLMLDRSKFVWDLIPHMAFFQFPWRFLLITSFFVSFLGGSIIYLIPKDRKFLVYIIGILVSIAVIILNYKVFVPQKNLNVNSENYVSKYALNWTTSKISDEYMPRNYFIPLAPQLMPKGIVVKNEQIQTSITTYKTNRLFIKANARKNADLSINLAYFPGWHVFIDQKQVWFKYHNRGLTLTVPKGEHTIDIRFIQTPYERAGNILSIAGVIILIAGIIRNQRQTAHA